MKFLGLFVLLVVTTINASILGEQPFALIEDLPEAESRIINGQIAAVGQFPWQAFVKINMAGGYAVCGGALICDRWVLTAAHCVQGGNSFTLYLGSVNQSQAVEPGRVVVNAKRAFHHERYNPATLKNDIALIELSQRVGFTSRIQPIPLDPTYLGGNVNVTVSGWGRTSNNSGTSPRLRFTNLKTITNRECVDHYSPTLIVFETMCCKGENKKSTCMGDSGGPLVRRKPNGKQVHVGVVSFVSGKGCESGVPSGYIRTASYLTWITKNINGTCSLPSA